MNCIMCAYIAESILNFVDADPPDPLKIGYQLLCGCARAPAGTTAHASYMP